VDLMYGKEWGDGRVLFARHAEKMWNELMGVLDSARSGFGNHMFCEYRSANNTLYDACAGPALGEHDSLGYMVNVIDTVIPVRMRVYDEGIEKPWQVPVQETGYPMNKKEIELNHKYCVSDIDGKGMGVDDVK
jgi:hypothetical protein